MLHTPFWHLETDVKLRGDFFEAHCIRFRCQLAGNMEVTFLSAELFSVSKEMPGALDLFKGRALLAWNYWCILVHSMCLSQWQHDNNSALPAGC